MATGLIASNLKTQQDYNDYYSQNMTADLWKDNGAAKAYASGKANGLDLDMINVASGQYKPPVDQDRKKQIYDAFSTSMKNTGITSASDPRWVEASAALTKQANEMGINNTEYSTAMGDWNNNQIKQSQYWNGGNAANADQLKTARAWSDGKTSEEIAAKGKEMNLSPEQFASVFGETGANATKVGYGTEGGLIDSAKGLTWDGNSWVRASTGSTSTPPPSGTSATGSTTTSTTTSSGGGGGDGGASTTTPTTQGTQPAQQAQLSRWETSPDQFVENRLGNILAADGVTLQAARGRGQQMANERGLINSSIGGRMAEDAVVDQALRIATPDAATAASAAQFNAGAANDMSKFNTTAVNQFARDNNMQAYDLQKMAVNFGYDLSKMDKQQINDMVKLATAQGYTKENMATNQGYTQTNMATGQGYTEKNMGLQNGFDLGKMDAQQRNVLQTLAAQNGFDLNKLSAQQTNDLAKMAAAQGYNVDNLKLSYSQDLGKIAAQGDISKTIAAMGAGAQAAAAQLSADTQKSIAVMNSKLSTNNLITSSTVNLSNTFASGLSAILNNKDLDAGARDAATKQFADNYDRALTLIGEINDPNAPNSTASIIKGILG